MGKYGYVDVDKLIEYANNSKVGLDANDIARFPKADVRENVHGEWLYEQLIPNTIEGKMYGECSVCHKVRIVDNFCPHCGALMSESLKLAEVGKAIAEGLNEGLNAEIPPSDRISRE